MKDFSVIEFATYLKNNKPLLLDVREQWEWDKCPHHWIIWLYFRKHTFGISKINNYIAGTVLSVNIVKYGIKISAFTTAQSSRKL
jgi:hypothetical protein